MLLKAYKDIGWTVNRRKTKYMDIIKAWWQNEHIRIGSSSYEKVKTFKYLGSLYTNQNPIHEEIKCKLKVGNSCYYWVQTLLSSQLLSRIEN